MIILVFSLLTLFCFLYVLNLYLRGSMKPMIEFFLSILIIALVIFSFFVSKWWVGIIALLSVFILTSICRPIAQLLAFKILGYRTGVEDENVEASRFLKSMKNDGDVFKAMEKFKKKEAKDKERLLKLYDKQFIRNILTDNNLAFEDYFKLMTKISYGLADIKWEILGSRKDLKKLIDLYKSNVSDDEIFIHFRDYRG